MKFTEQELKNYAQPLSETEIEKCKNAIRMVRDAMKETGFIDDSNDIQNLIADTYTFGTVLRSKDNNRIVKLFLQGSFANNTNVRRESDVDIAIILESMFKPKYRTGTTSSAYGHVDATDSLYKFKDDVQKVLEYKFGDDVVRYVTFLWRINPFEKVPKLRKEYKGKLISNYDDIERDIQISVNQNLFETKINFKSGESSSKSITANFYEEYGTKMLSFGYINNPKAIHKHRSPIHYGMCILEIKDKNNLEGQYFTDRCTRGDIVLHSVTEKNKTIKKQLVESKK